MTLVAGATWIGHAKPGGIWLAGCGPTLGAHMVQGYSSNPVATARAHPWPPHLWYNPLHAPHGTKRQLLQCIDLDRSAYALAHPAGTPETNRAGFIQVEVFGFSQDAPNWSKASLDAYVDDVIVPICRAAGIDPARYLETGGSEFYGPGAHRMTAPAPGYGFNGLLAHQHVWANDHWDQGRMNITYISARAVAILSPAPPEPEPEHGGTTMDYVIKPSDKSVWMLYDDGLMTRAKAWPTGATIHGPDKATWNRMVGVNQTARVNHNSEREVFNARLTKPDRPSWIKGDSLAYFGMDYVKRIP